MCHAESCRSEILNQLHEGHFGVDCTKLRARDSVYWSNINRDIEELVKTCNLWQNQSKTDIRDPVILRGIPVCAWSATEIDLFTFYDHTFLLVVDITSQFPLFRILSSENTRSVLNVLKGVYSDFGLPRKIITNNGHCFKSLEFKEFHAKLNVATETSSAYNHSSIGSVERMAQTVKQIMTKNPENAWLGLLIFKATWIPDVHKSPAELLNSRKFRTNLPVIDLNQRAHEPDTDKMVEKLESTKAQTGKEFAKIKCWNTSSI